jgi:uncharacterized membrane protein
LSIAEEKTPMSAGKPAWRTPPRGSSGTWPSSICICFGSDLWVAINVGPLIPRWDPSFAILGTVASIEAIFLSTFILIRQNRMADADRKHADLDLQVSLLAEHEVTKVVAIVTAIADHLGLEPDLDREELEELKQHVAPETVLDKLEDLNGQLTAFRFLS